MPNSTLSRPRFRRFTIVAQDPSVQKESGGMVMAQVDVPFEELAPGPRGHRIQVVDYDAGTRLFYAPAVDSYRHGTELCDFVPSQAEDAVLLRDRRFHAQNVYAVAMRLLGRFEFALGRRVAWGFDSHQLKIAPHAFAEANAYYSRKDEALFLGYFPFAGDVGRGLPNLVFTCLSHDVIAHETTHALLDGLRQYFLYPSSPDQAAFHEGFADLVAILSAFALPELVAASLDDLAGGEDRIKGRPVVPLHLLDAHTLGRNLLLKVGKQLGTASQATRGRALRESAALEPSERYLLQPEFQEPHRRGELVVAATLRTFTSAWAARIESLGSVGQVADLPPMPRGWVDRQRVCDEGAEVADYLLTVCIRALDYLPPIHLTFGDFLSAALTAEQDLAPRGWQANIPKHLRKAFGEFGITPASLLKTHPVVDGGWQRFDDSMCVYDGVHLEGLQRDPEEVFAFVWANRHALELCDEAFTQVLSVRPCVRVGADGFILRDTIVEVMQKLRLTVAEWRQRGIECPSDMRLDASISLYGGCALIFDERGRLKFNVHNRLLNAKRQAARIAHLWATGSLEERPRMDAPFAALHRMQASGAMEGGW